MFGACDRSRRDDGVNSTTWEQVPPGEVCQINSRLNGIKVQEPDAPVTFVPMAAVEEARGEDRCAGEPSLTGT